MEINIIKNKLSYLKELLEMLKVRIDKYNNTKDEDEKITLYLATSKLCEEIVEIGIKINNIILEENNSYAPTYFETFSKLAKFYNLDKKKLNDIAKTTSLRNKVSHEYEELIIDKAIIYFSKFPKIYNEYIKIILKIIEK